MNMSAKKKLEITGFLIFFIFILSYGLWGSHNLIFGIKVKNVSIADGAKYPDSVIEVTGNATNATNLSLNGRKISINQDGDFNETIALLPGYNVINIRAQDKFGYVDEKNYKLIY